MPKEWRIAQIILIPKPKEWDGNIDITRLITLIENTRKILTKILTARISKACELYNVLKGYNTSVLKNTSTAVPIHVINVVAKHARKFDNKAWFTFQDMKKAYDSRIFYDPLLCEIKQANYNQRYQLTAEWKKQGMQSILNTASSFFRIIDIEINLDKTKTMVIRLSKKKSVLVEPLKFANRKNETVLNIIRSDIKAIYGVIKKKHITEKQTIYIFNSVLKLKDLSHCKEESKPLSRFSSQCHTSHIFAKDKITDLLIRLNSNDIAGMTTKIRLANLQTQRWSAHSILEYLINEQSKPGVNLIVNIIQIIDERDISFKSFNITYGMPNSSRPHAHLIEIIIAPGVVYSKYRQSDSGKIPKWFKILESTIIMDKHRNINIAQCETRNVQDKLKLRKEIEISTDELLVKAGSEDARRAATFVIHRIEANFGITVNGTLLSTKTKAKTVLLALEAVPYKCKLILNTDMTAHTSISKNKMTDKLAKKATTFDTVEWAYNAENINYIPSCRGVELDLNIRHFLSQQTDIQGALN
ncbi:hypothetical protein G9A89_020627 [Geosiphon pyriformis]|nr:hypothetical protein G9A89_020627 [Geosiphon pyriformis]